MGNGEKNKNGKFWNHFFPVISLPSFPTVILLCLALLYIFLIEISSKRSSAIAGDLAVMNAKRTHYFDSLNGSHNFQLENRNEKMKIDGLSQLLTFTCTYLLKNSLNFHHQEKLYSFNILRNLIQAFGVIKEKNSLSVLKWKPQDHTGSLSLALYTV